MIRSTTLRPSALRLRLEEIIVSIIESMNTFEKIYKAVSKIPRGKVSTYGAIAKYVVITNPRVVGYALHVNKDPDNIPCHRVVNKQGELAKGYAFGGLGIQEQLLRQEGIKLENDKVMLNKYLFNFT